MDLLDALVKYIVEFEEDGIGQNNFISQEFNLSLLLIQDKDIGYLYTTAVFHNKFSLSDRVLNHTRYSLNNKFIKSEIIFCANCGRFDCISRFLDDGYFPQIGAITGIITFFQKNNFHQSENTLFQRLIHIHHLRRIERIRNNLRNNL